MRGDSIRDLYAKALALVGLGLLAAAGAIVDYWPTGNTFPIVAPQPRQGLVARARPVPANWSGVGMTPAADRAPRVSITSAPLPSIHAGAPAVAWGDPIATLTAPAVELPAPVLVVASASTATVPSTVTASPGELLILPPPASPVMTAVAWSAETGDDSFLTGAFKRTGASIIRTSARTGASIVDAVRTVGGAVRRALPN